MTKKTLRHARVYTNRRGLDGIIYDLERETCFFSSIDIKIPFATLQQAIPLDESSRSKLFIIHYRSCQIKRVIERSSTSFLILK